MSGILEVNIFENLFYGVAIVASFIVILMGAKFTGVKLCLENMRTQTSSLHSDMQDIRKTLQEISIQQKRTDIRLMQEESDRMFQESLEKIRNMNKRIGHTVNIHTKGTE